MNSIVFYIFHALIIFSGPIFVLGLINRTKAICAGRKGPKLYQTAFDIKRLLKKKPVYSETTSWIFQIAPTVVLSTTVIAAFFVPILPKFSPVHFSFDFIGFVYAFALGRFWLALSALDTGSSFEGMGVSRDVTFSTFVEPGFFLISAVLCSLSQEKSFQWVFLNIQSIPIFYPLSFIALFMLALIESGRVPIDDPNTHLELTMIHEVMILDHSGPDLAIMTYASGIKLVIWLGLISNLLNPFSLETDPLLAPLTTLFFMGALSILIGVIESVMARLKMAVVPMFSVTTVFIGLVMFGILFFNR